MANLLSLRTAKADVIVRFDAAFFDGHVVPLLARRGFAFTASATTPADLTLAGDTAALDRLLGGRAASLPLSPATPSPSSGLRMQATARVWRALVVVDDGRGRPAARSRDVGGAGGAGGWDPARGRLSDSVRGPGGRRVKARPRRRTTTTIAGAPPPPPSTAPARPAASDPAAFALGHLMRLADHVVEAVRDVGDDVVVVVVDGRVLVDGVDRGAVVPG